MKITLTLLTVSLLTIFSGCSDNREKEIPPETKEEKPVAGSSSMQEELFAAGIDFMARGNEPFWSLDADFDKTMKFTSLTDIDELNTPAVEGVKAQDADVTRYHSVTEAGELIVTIIGDSCVDNMSGEAFPLTVNVMVRPSAYEEFREFKGCGRYLYDTKLNNDWVLEEMNGRKMPAGEEDSGTPSIVFDTNEKRLAGSGGCNRIMGSFQVMGDKIKFGMVASTMMACPDMETEREYLNIITENTMTYKIDRDKLLLEDNKGNKLVFTLNQVEK